MRKWFVFFIVLNIFGNVEDGSYQIKRASFFDIDAIIETHYISWHATYDSILDPVYLEKNTKERLKKYWEKFFNKQKHDNRFVLIAVSAEKIIGVISAGPIKIDTNEPNAISSSFGQLNYDSEIYKFYILPLEQRKGVGKVLLRESYKCLLENGFKKVIVRVFTQNDEGCRFYKYVGFQQLYSLEAIDVEAPYIIYGAELT